jgi:hypothetical protein
LAAGVILAVTVGAGAFALLATLDRATSGEKLAARVIGRLDPLRATRSLLTFDQFRATPTFCMIGDRRDEIWIGRLVRLEIMGAHVRQLSGPRQPASELPALAALSACPRFLASGLTARLFAGRTTMVKTAPGDGRPADVFEVSKYAHRPVVQLVVARKNLDPLPQPPLERPLRDRRNVTESTPSCSPIVYGVYKLGI